MGAALGAPYSKEILQVSVQALLQLSQADSHLLLERWICWHCVRKLSGLLRGWGIRRLTGRQAARTKVKVTTREKPGKDLLPPYHTSTTKMLLGMHSEFFPFFFCHLWTISSTWQDGPSLSYLPSRWVTARGCSDALRCLEEKNLVFHYIGSFRCYKVKKLETCELWE